MNLYILQNTPQARILTESELQDYAIFIVAAAIRLDVTTVDDYMLGRMLAHYQKANDAEGIRLTLEQIKSHSEEEVPI